jgi:pimeloyl-ACP methyl ester carboxylesterase
VRLGLLPIHCEFYASDPEDPLLLFLPGLTTYCALYGEFLSALAQQGFNVVGIDPRGHGFSGGKRGTYTVEQIVADCGAVIDHFSEEISGPVVVMGYSIGSPLALAVAEADARIKALVCGTLMLGSNPPDWIHLMGWWSLEMAAYWTPGMTVDVRRVLPMEDLARTTRFGVHYLNDKHLVWEYPVTTLSSVFNHRHQALNKSLPFPAVVITGDRDEVVPPDYQQRLLGNMKHHFDFALLEDATHMAPDNRAVELAQLTSDWVHQALPN